MSFTKSFASVSVSAVLAFAFSLPAFAQDPSIMIEAAYARSSNPKAGAIFLVINNQGDADDRLLDVRSDVAMRVELHGHMDMGEGLMKMMQVENGLSIPAGGSHALARGGDHVMLMGLKTPFQQGELVPLTLIFENFGAVDLDVVVDQTR